MKKSPIKNMAYWKAKNQATPLKGVEGASTGRRLPTLSAGLNFGGWGTTGKATAADRLDPEAGKGGVNYSPPTQDANTDPALDEKIEEKVIAVVNQKTGEGLV